MGVGCTRVIERVLTALGKFSEAPSRFTPAVDVSNGGVLWALPSLLSNGLLRHTKDYFALPNGFYSAIHIFLLLAFMALSRIKSNEQLRYSPAGELGLSMLPMTPRMASSRARLSCRVSSIHATAMSKSCSVSASRGSR